MVNVLMALKPFLTMSICHKGHGLPHLHTANILPYHRTEELKWFLFPVPPDLLGDRLWVHSSQVKDCTSENSKHYRKKGRMSSSPGSPQMRMVAVQFDNRTGSVLDANPSLISFINGGEGRYTFILSSNFKFSWKHSTLIANKIFLIGIETNILP
jgi:hypothetical protein